MNAPTINAISNHWYRPFSWASQYHSEWTRPSYSERSAGIRMPTVACATTSNAGGVHEPHGFDGVAADGENSSSAVFSRMIHLPLRFVSNLADGAATVIASRRVSLMRVSPLVAASSSAARRSASERNSDSRRLDSPRRTASARFASSSLARPADGAASAMRAKRAVTLLGLGLASGALYRHSSMRAPSGA